MRTNSRNSPRTQLAILYGLAEWRLSESKSVGDTILTAVSTYLPSPSRIYVFYGMWCDNIDY